MQREATLKRCKVDPTLASSETDDTDASENKTKLQLEKLKQVNKKQKRKIKELGNRVDMLTLAVGKLQKSLVLLETSSKEKKTPNEKVEEYECYFESVDADLKNGRSIFVEGFDCSFPRDAIKSTLRKHFSSCGAVSRVLIPFHCKTGRPVGYGFISMIGDAEKALKLHGSSLQGQRLLVAMACDRDESICFTNRKGCERCHIAKNVRRLKHFHESVRMRIPFSPN